MNKITAYTLFDENFKSIADIVIPNNKKYFDSHKIQFNVYDKNLDEFVPSKIVGRYKKYWIKIFILKQLLEKADSEWIFFIDTDAAIIDHSIPLQLFINLSKPTKEFIACETDGDFDCKYWNINTGVFFIKNSEYTKSIINFFIKVLEQNGCESNTFSCEQPLIQEMLRENIFDFSKKASIFPSNSFNHDGNFIYHPCIHSTLDMDFQSAIIKKEKILSEKLKTLLDKDSQMLKEFADSPNFFG